MSHFIALSTHFEAYLSASFSVIVSSFLSIALTLSLISVSSSFIIICCCSNKDSCLSNSIIFSLLVGPLFGILLSLSNKTFGILYMYLKNKTFQAFISKIKTVAFDYGFNLLSSRSCCSCWRVDWSVWRRNDITWNCSWLKLC